MNINRTNPNSQLSICKCGDACGIFPLVNLKTLCFYNSKNNISSFNVYSALNNYKEIIIFSFLLRIEQSNMYLLNTRKKLTFIHVLNAMMMVIKSYGSILSVFYCKYREIAFSF